MLKFLINSLTDNLLKKEIKKNNSKWRKKVKEILDIQEKKFDLIAKKMQSEIKFLKDKEKKFFEDKNFLENALENKSDEFHELIQKTSLIFQSAMVDVNKIVYQGVIPLIENTEHQLRRTNKKIIKDDSNIKIFQSNMSHDKKIEKIKNKQEKMEASL